MYIIKKVIHILIIIFSIFGIFSFILFILGYRPIRNIDTFPDWEAISAIGTFLAVFAALFITKWQNIIENKKSLQIEMLLVETNSFGRISYKEIVSDRRVDEICLKFVNTGNRKIIIDNIAFLFKNNHTGNIIPENIPQLNTNNKITLPYTLNTEEAVDLYISTIYLKNVFTQFNNAGKIIANENIVIRATDTTNKEYKLITKLSYEIFLNLTIIS